MQRDDRWLCFEDTTSAYPATEWIKAWKYMEPALRVAGGIDTHEESDMPGCPYDSVHLGFNTHSWCVCVSYRNSNKEWARSAFFFLFLNGRARVLPTLDAIYHIIILLESKICWIRHNDLTKWFCPVATSSSSAAAAWSTGWRPGHRYGLRSFNFFHTYGDGGQRLVYPPKLAGYLLLGWTSEFDFWKLEMSFCFV